MGIEHDEIAGVAGLFGALTRAELTHALAELAFKRDEDVGDPSERIKRAIAAYRLVAFEPTGSTPTPVTADELGEDTLLAPGPTAFPRLPDGAEDLPHILDVSERNPDKTALGDALETRFRADAARAVAADDATRMATLLDVSYDIESWGPIQLHTVRERLDSALGDGSASDGSGGSAPDDA